MSSLSTKLKLRTGILLNLLALAFLVLSWTGNPVNKTRIGLIITGAFALVVLLYTYYFTYWQTGLWKFTHTTGNKLDEREYYLNNQALRFSYSIFTVVVLIYLLYSVLSKKVLHIIPVAGLIYFAHILPAVYLGWRRK